MVNLSRGETSHNEKAGRSFQGTPAYCTPNAKAHLRANHTRASAKRSQSAHRSSGAAHVRPRSRCGRGGHVIQRFRSAPGREGRSRLGKEVTNEALDPSGATDEDVVRA